VTCWRRQARLPRCAALVEARGVLQLDEGRPSAARATFERLLALERARPSLLRWLTHAEAGVRPGATLSF
jgi:hypothetical protein